MSALAVVRRKPLVSPERVALASAVADYQAEAAREVALRAASEAAGEAVREARSGLERAAEGVEAAKRAAVEHAIAIASGRTPEPGMTVRQAKATADDAADGLATAIEARDRLLAELASAGGSFGVRDRALAVVKIEARHAAEALIAAAESQLRDLADKVAQLEILAPVCFGRNMYGCVEHPRLSFITNNLRAMGEGLDAEEKAGKERWTGVISSLMADASAPVT